MFNFNKIKKVLNEKITLQTKKAQMVKDAKKAKEQEKKDNFISSVLEDLQKNHNHSWYQEIYDRNKDTLNDAALFYRGTTITYGEMFAKMREYAKSLKSLGIKEGTEIPVCMSNTPEFVYLLGAASIVGAKINSFAYDFDRDYLKEIINGCDSELLFIEDNYYNEIKNVIDESKVNKIIISSLANSLGADYEKYKKYDECHSDLFIDKTPKIISDNDNIISISDFEKEGDNYKGDIIADTDMDTEFTVTYSSGTTSNRPKAIVHTTRSFITIGRCHDPEIQKSASMKKFTIQSNAPTFSNTDLISNISDALMQGSKLALEPVYDGTGEFFIDSLLINEPTYVIATRSLWLKTFKKIDFDKKYKDVKFKNLLVPFAVGEGIEPGEEKYINKGLRKAKAGTAMLNIPVSPVTISLAGGDCEHGGIFWQLYRKYASKEPGYVLRKEQSGMKAFEMVEYAILDKDGNYCKPYEFGKLVANSPCTMKKYKNNEEATKKFFVKDATGKVWGDCCVYAYLDHKNKVHMKGRVPKDEKEVPPFKFTDVVARDTKQILSCETVNSDDAYVVHLEMQPSCKNNVLEVLQSAEGRCKKCLGEDLTSKIVYRIHSRDGFDTSHSGKRDLRKLVDEGIDKAIKPIVVDGNISYVTASSYLNDTNKSKKYVKE